MICSLLKFYKHRKGRRVRILFIVGAARQRAVVAEPIDMSVRDSLWRRYLTLFVPRVLANPVNRLDTAHQLTLPYTP